MNKENKFKKILKNNWKKISVVFAACLVVVAMSLAIGLSVGGGGEVEVATTAISFTLPMNDVVVVKDYCDDALQYNATLNRWEIHLAVDLSSDDSTVFAIADGVVSDIDSNSLEGYIVTIEHTDGFVSVYSSLSSDVLVEIGDSVSKGQEIATADSSAGSESTSGAHLHLVMLKDDEVVDPNTYLDLQTK